MQDLNEYEFLLSVTSGRVLKFIIDLNSGLVAADLGDNIFESIKAWELPELKKKNNNTITNDNFDLNDAVRDFVFGVGALIGDLQLDDFIDRLEREVSRYPDSDNLKALLLSFQQYQQMTGAGTENKFTEEQMKDFQYHFARGHRKFIQLHKPSERTFLEVSQAFSETHGGKAVCVAAFLLSAAVVTLGTCGIASIPFALAALTYAGITSVAAVTTASTAAIGVGAALMATSSSFFTNGVIHSIGGRQADKEAQLYGQDDSAMNCFFDV